MRWIALAWWPLALAAAAPTPPEPSLDWAGWERTLAGPVRVRTVAGRWLEGRLTEVGDDRLQLTPEGAGDAVEYVLPRAEVGLLQLPGENLLQVARDLRQDGCLEPAARLLGMLWESRQPVLDWLDEEARQPLADLPATLLELGRWEEAAESADRLAPHCTSPSTRLRLAEIALEADFRAGLADPARRRAEALAAAAPADRPNGLACLVLALQTRAAGHTVPAWEIALGPIVFSGPLADPWLAHHYALAITCALEARDRPAAARLSREMRQRGLPWPSDLGLDDPALPDPEPLPTAEETSDF